RTRQRAIRTNSQGRRAVERLNLSGVICCCSPFCSLVVREVRLTTSAVWAKSASLISGDCRMAGNDPGAPANPAESDAGDHAYAAVMARARALVPELRDRAARSEELRRLPPETEKEF